MVSYKALNTIGVLNEEKYCFLVRKCKRYLHKLLLFYTRIFVS